MSRQDLAETALRSSIKFYAQNAACLSYYCHTDPILQEGPCCGLVALAMAANAFHKNNITFKDIFQTAKKMNYTVEGEMFSAYNMAALADICLGCSASVMTELASNKKRIVNQLLDGYPLLVPYDADSNHVPCFKRGNFAHWAIITGVCFAYPQLESDEYEDVVIQHFEQGCKLREIIDNSRDLHKVLLYARQGKTKHLAVWSLEELLKSNGNLMEINPKHDITKMILPRIDVLGELRDKAVVLRPSSSSV